MWNDHLLLSLVISVRGDISPHHHSLTVINLHNSLIISFIRWTGSLYLPLPASVLLSSLLCLCSVAGVFPVPAHTGNPRLARIQANQWCFNGGGTAALQTRRDQSHPECEVRPSSLSACADCLFMLSLSDKERRIIMYIQMIKVDKQVP